MLCGMLYSTQKLPQNLSQIRFFSNLSPDREPATGNLREDSGGALGLASGEE